MSDSTIDPKVIVALDFDQRAACMTLVDQLDPSHCRLKIGKEMFTLFGPGILHPLHDRGFQVFLDLKFHDIPVTTAKAVRAAADLGVWMTNVHASGGLRMLEASAEALANRSHKPLLIGVTVLTSSTSEELSQQGISRSPQEQVLALSSLVQQAGLDGVVCSAQEAASLRARAGDDFLLITPGIRPAGCDNQDQRRVMTPTEAIAAGSSYLVVGRPITQAENPVMACESIIASLPQ